MVWGPIYRPSFPGSEMGPKIILRMPKLRKTTHGGATMIIKAEKIRQLNFHNISRSSHLELQF